MIGAGATGSDATFVVGAGSGRQPTTSVKKAAQRSRTGGPYPSGSGLQSPPPSICALVRYVLRNCHDGASFCGIVPSSRTFVT